MSDAKKPDEPPATKHKLTVDKETVGNLTDKDLDEAAGGTGAMCIAATGGCVATTGTGRIQKTE